MEQDNLNMSSLITQYVDVRNQIITDMLENSINILNEYHTIERDIKSKNRESSYLFNPLKQFNIGETQHSILLANLLNPIGAHGQGDLFLKLFLNSLGIAVNENDVWSVTAEKGRIDILIKRKHPHAVIIIENKSNYAADRDCQLYKYWYQEMYIPNAHQPYQYTLEKKDTYRIVYLSPTKGKIPQLYSLNKPDWDYLSEDLPLTLRIEDIELLSFDREIVSWLNECSSYLKENHRLREYVNQYIELWKS